ncbi:hypothetical protein IE81DRAFT_61232 [Ceraceosorus guamensis]|uniref:Uncharacterized protein n=1 Tax=Ceraceosorus guamensis TaxID=1522189 RepID=A0A316W224_9BASI|nr:hypothetical protein IE81DRAFT_61232 [Ceraceosorus guamensis]PWN43840.1 hypothetical protein IE81DRAFT_61232 [Ceraceosorus guamensis]
MLFKRKEQKPEERALPCELRSASLPLSDLPGVRRRSRSDRRLAHGSMPMRPPTVCSRDEAFIHGSKLRGESKEAVPTILRVCAAHCESIYGLGSLPQENLASPHLHLTSHEYAALESRICAAIYSQEFMGPLRVARRVPVRLLFSSERAWIADRRGEQVWKPARGSTRLNLSRECGTAFNLEYGDR